MRSRNSLLVLREDMGSPRFLVGSMLLIFLVFCVLFAFVQCLVCPVLPVALDCPFLIAPSVFSNVHSTRFSICGTCKFMVKYLRSPTFHSIFKSFYQSHDSITIRVSDGNRTPTDVETLFWLDFLYKTFMECVPRCPKENLDEASDRKSYRATIYRGYSDRYIILAFISLRIFSGIGKGLYRIYWLHLRKC